MNRRFMGLNPRILYGFWVSVILLVFLPTLRWLWVSWTHSSYYTHAWAVLLSGLLAAVFQYKRSHSRNGLSPVFALLWLVLALALTGVGFAIGLNSFKAWGMLSLLGFGALYFLDQKDGKGLSAFFVLVSCVVPLPFLQSILSALQQVAVAGSVWLLSLGGIATQAWGNLISLPGGGELLVAEACSGLKSVLVLPPLVLFATYVFGFSGPIRWMLTMLSVPVALLSNLIRVTAVLAIGARTGVDSAISFWDKSAGILFYGISLLVMTMMAYGLFKLFRKKPRVVGYFALVALLLGPLEAGAMAQHGSFTDTNPYYFTSHQGTWYTQTDLFYENNMAHLPMVLGDWEGEDVPISDGLPVFLRLYEHWETGTAIFIQPVYGEEESAFHTAEVCYIDDGWRLEQRGFKTLMINGQSLPVRYVTAKTEEHSHHIYYWYVWPDTRRVITDGALMIRLSIEMEEGGESDAERAAVDFIEELSLASFGSERLTRIPLPNPDVSAWKEELRRNKQPYPKLSPELTEARHQVENWLLNQMVPNIVVRRPAYARRNLILSYETDPSHPGYRYTFSKSALYDNALAAVAFTMMGEQDRASAVLDALSRVLNKHWDLFFSFNTHNTWPNDQDSYGAIIRTGASAWVGYALCFHLARELMDDPDLFRENPDAVRYLQLAERIGERLLVRQVTEEGDPRQGLLTGGEGSYVLRLKEGKVVEEYVPGEVTWSSVEHNIDSYFFYRALGRLTGNKKWFKAASEIQEALLRAAWNPEKSQFNRGVSKLEKDLVQALDAASWGSLVLKSWGEDKKAALALTALDKYQSKDDGVAGYRPYSEGPIYESFAIQKHFYPDNREGIWENMDFVWPEGSLGVGLAYFRQGRREKAEQILKGMLQLQAKNGGISYATKDVPFQFSTAPSVASNAWWIILASTLEDPLLDVLFWGQ